MFDEADGGMRMFYNIDMRISQILGENQTAVIFDRFLPGMRARVEGLMSLTIKMTMGQDEGVT